MSYFIVRVNTNDHPTIDLAMRDMAFIIERRSYWKMSVQPNMPIGSPIIAMGGHGGRGLFLHGIVRGEWKTAKSSGVYKNRLPVQWDNTVYMHPASSVAAALVLANRGNLRAHTSISKDEYRAVLHFMLGGQAVNPWVWTSTEVAA